ncbi:hypothetical protein C2845_PM14G07070 [Panicum miliaceum]|uniref:Uncharacterized protein n=1 Tax=Panicum miliaceum TaxID=4540 RepID=A0A3L6PRN2_PANMI|nr:hypothetical protein C2845_PM14G07070 [Panicum miliaceum]
MICEFRDTETDMEQTGARVAKEQEQITADGAPTVLNQKRWLLVLYVPMPAPSLATCSMECQPRDEPQLSRPMTQ